MKKLKLKGAGNTNGRSYFKIEKHRDLHDFLADFLVKCGFEDNNYLTIYKTEQGDITLLEDVQENYKNEYFDIDIFYGHKSVILVVRTINEKQAELVNNIIHEFCEFVEKRR